MLTDRPLVFVQEIDQLLVNMKEIVLTTFGDNQKGKRLGVNLFGLYTVTKFVCGEAVEVAKTRDLPHAVREYNAL